MKDFFTVESMVCQDCGWTFDGDSEDYCPECDSHDVQSEAELWNELEEEEIRAEQEMIKEAEIENWKKANNIE